ncbi:hypothetical protein PLA107_030825 (plasmid) [Pseudomonas amygdali pv. lachrymans str. M301315]|uniref:Uncharacterized protein n=1 Tax=Pseudomonas amygdali pv. lachrymans str. M301315 TaxID=629260 RepID=A0AAD0PUG0_PSEAV|nr:hypothetical protein PLA107_030825 [Pseudomonas amygdali pv. lachrymans str. M301315]
MGCWLSDWAASSLQRFVDGGLELLLSPNHAVHAVVQHRDNGIQLFLIEYNTMVDNAKCHV